MKSPAVAAQGGKEEIRASFLKPYFLRLRSEKGVRAYDDSLARAALAPQLIENETSWLSLASTLRALKELELAFADSDALAHRGAWAVHPDTLGTYVRLLRASTTPLDAYRLLAEHSQEFTRIGVYHCEPVSPTSARMTYRPEDLDEAPQDDERLDLARAGELAGFPRLWGLPDAEVIREKSLARKDPESVFLVSWRPFYRPFYIPLSMVLGAVVLGAVGVFSGSLTLTLLSTVLGAAVGGGVGYLLEKSHRDELARVFERHRIQALERGLEIRGELAPPAVTPGELDGTVLGGKYRIVHRIGSGGIGVVYSAEHMSLGTMVAVKVLRGAAAKDASEIARLRREAQVQGTVEHPNVTRTLDLDQMPDGSLYVVMELLRGRTLADRLTREGPLPSGEAIPIFVQVCRALAAAHAKEIVHRDLKPGNIFLCQDGVVKVLDFGMSKLQSAEALTQDGYTLGTPEYMAPEQCIGGAVEARTDLYALGVLMYEALTGELPIQAVNRRDLLDLHQRQVPLSMRQRRPELALPVSLDVAVMTCLRKKIRERPRSASDLADMLESIPLAGLPTSVDELFDRRTPAGTSDSEGELP